MEALSSILSGLIEEFPEYKKENETIWKFIAKCQDPKLIVQEYHQDFDRSGEGEGSTAVSLKHFCERNRQQGEGIVIAQLPACIPHWVQELDDKLLPEGLQKSFPTGVHSVGEYNCFLPGGVYPNSVRSKENICDVKCPSIFIALPLICKSEVSRIYRWKLKGEKYLKNSVPYFGPQALLEYHYPERDTWRLSELPTVKQLMYTQSNGENVLIVDQVWVAIYPDKNHLLLFTDHVLNEERELLYNRTAGTKHISIKDLERLKRFKSGVILDAVLLILELSKSEKFNDYLKFYEREVAGMQYRTHKHEPDPSQSLEPDFNRALTEIPITLKICHAHVSIISSLEDAIREHKLVNDADDEQLLGRLFSQGLEKKRKEIAKLEDLLKNLQSIRQQYFDNAHITEQIQLNRVVNELVEMGQRMDQGSKWTIYLATIATVFVPMQLCSSYFSMSDFGVEETQILFWVSSITITLTLVVLSIWIMDYRFVVKLFQSSQRLKTAPILAPVGSSIA